MHKQSGYVLSSQKIDSITLLDYIIAPVSVCRHTGQSEQGRVIENNNALTKTWPINPFPVKAPKNAQMLIISSKIFWPNFTLYVKILYEVSW